MGELYCKLYILYFNKTLGEFKVDKKWLLSFTKAWELLIVLPLPLQMDNSIRETEDNGTLSACFPLVGASIGICFFCLSWFIALLLPVKIASSLIGGLLLGILSELVLSGGNTLTLTSYFQARQSGCSGFETASVLDSVSTSTTPQVNQIYMLSLYLIKVISLSIFIYYDRSNWIVVVYTLSFLVRSQMLKWNCIRTSKPLFEFQDEADSFNLPWIISTVICVLILGFYALPAVGIVLLITYFLIKFIKKTIDAKIGGVSGSIISAAGTFSEIILLLSGLILVIRE